MHVKITFRVLTEVAEILLLRQTFGNFKEFSIHYLHAALNLDNGEGIIAMCAHAHTQSLESEWMLSDPNLLILLCYNGH